MDAVMVGHIAVPSLDPSQLPASLSYPITTGLLREELGFQGLIVTDGMSMKGITAQFSQAEACVMAVLAGADILLVCPASTEEGQAMIDRVTEAVRQGEISMERLEASVERILDKKAKYGLTREDFRQPPFDPEKLEREDNQKTADELARRALSASNGFAVPTREEAEASPVTLIWDRQVDFFAARLRGRAEIRREHKLDSFAELPGFLAQCEAEEGSWLFALTHNKPIPADVLAALDRFAAARPGKVQLVHFGSPYDLAHLSHVPALLLYDRAPSLQKAAADYWEGIR
ncbi:hypothetical protein N6H14_18305 [Paenibacillus sp. CC-CFT747]|nr:hypothetical protein N6H14_18305 [Paenibacillus sp. CC-CFT747]